MTNTFEITEKILKEFSQLQSTEIKSPYCEKTLSWNKKNNKHFSDWSNIYNYLNYFILGFKSNEIFEKRYDVKYYHIALIKRIEIHRDSEIVSIYSKRPYSNSDVYNDIEKEIKKGDGEIPKNKEYFLKNVHLETLNIFDKAIKELAWGCLIFTTIGIFAGKREGITKEGIYKAKEYYRRKKYERVKNV